MLQEASLVEIANCGNHERAADVVFVHGLDGDAKRTWMAIPPRLGLIQRFWHWLTATENVPQPMVDFWPEWVASDFPEAGIWSLAYPAASTAWVGTAMPLPDRAAGTPTHATQGTRPTPSGFHRP